MTLDDFVERKPIRGRWFVFMRQRFWYDPERKELFFRIREPYFSAGKQYHWPGTPLGLGINKEALYYACRMNASISVFVRAESGKYYQAKARAWKAFAEKWLSVERHGSATIYICQWNTQHFKTIKVKRWDEKKLASQL